MGRVERKSDSFTGILGASGFQSVNGDLKVRQNTAFFVIKPFHRARAQKKRLLFERTRFGGKPVFAYEALFFESKSMNTGKIRHFRGKREQWMLESSQRAGRPSDSVGRILMLPKAKLSRL